MHLWEGTGTNLDQFAVLVGAFHGLTAELLLCLLQLSSKGLHRLLRRLLARPELGPEHNTKTFVYTATPPGNDTVYCSW